MGGLGGLLMLITIMSFGCGYAQTRLQLDINIDLRILFHKALYIKEMKFFTSKHQGEFFSILNHMLLNILMY